MRRTYPKRRRNSFSHSTYNQNNPSHTRLSHSSPHHNGHPRRFNMSENNRGCHRGYNSPDNHMHNGECTITSSSMFHQRSPKYQRTNSNENHLSSRRTVPYWVNNSKYYPKDTNHSPKFTIDSNEVPPYSPRQSKEPYWADTVGRKQDDTSPKLIHVREKHPILQTNEPYWMDSFEHYEVRSHFRDLHSTDDLVLPPRIQRELPEQTDNRQLLYRFPIQDPEFLKKHFESVKQKHKETATSSTSHTNEIKTGEISESKTTKKPENSDSHDSCSIAKHSENNSADSSSSIVTTYDSNGNFRVVPKENSSPQNIEKKEETFLPSSTLNRFENDPEQDDVELVLLDIQHQVKTSCKKKGEKEQKSNEIINTEILSMDHCSKESDSSLESCICKASIKSDDIKNVNDDAESLSDPESEVFDDIFLKTIGKEHKSDSHVSEDEFYHEVKKGSETDVDFDDEEAQRSPTFDSTLLRYLDSNIRKQIDSRELFSNVCKEIATDVNDSNEESDCTIEFPEVEQESKTCAEFERNARSSDTCNTVVGTVKLENYELNSTNKASENSQESVEKVKQSESISPNISENESFQRNKSDTNTTTNLTSQNVDNAYLSSEKDEKIVSLPLSFIKSSPPISKVNHLTENTNIVDLDQSCESVMSDRNISSVIDGTEIDNLITNVGICVNKTDFSSETVKKSETTDKKLDENVLCDRMLSSGKYQNHVLKNQNIGEVAFGKLDVQKSQECEMTDKTLKNSSLEESFEMNDEKFDSCSCENYDKEFAGEMASKENSSIDETIRLVREKCKDTVKENVKLFEQMINTSAKTERELTMLKRNKEIEHTMIEEENSSLTTNNSFEDNSSNENESSDFIPLREVLLPSVKKEMHKEKAENESERMSVSVSTDSLRRLSSETPRNQDCITYNTLYHDILTSKTACIDSLENSSNMELEEESVKDVAICEKEVENEFNIANFKTPNEEAITEPASEVAACDKTAVEMLNISEVNHIDISNQSMAKMCKIIKRQSKEENDNDFDNEMSTRDLTASQVDGKDRDELSETTIQVSEMEVAIQTGEVLENNVRKVNDCGNIKDIEQSMEVESSNLHIEMTNESSEIKVDVSMDTDDGGEIIDTITGNTFKNTEKECTSTSEDVEMSKIPLVSEKAEPVIIQVKTELLFKECIVTETQTLNSPDVLKKLVSDRDTNCKSESRDLCVVPDQTILDMVPDLIDSEKLQLGNSNSPILSKAETSSVIEDETIHEQVIDDETENSHLHEMKFLTSTVIQGETSDKNQVELQIQTQVDLVDKQASQLELSRSKSELDDGKIPLVDGQRTQLSDEIENDQPSQVSDEIKNEEPTQMNDEIEDVQPSQVSDELENDQPSQVSDEIENDEPSQVSVEIENEESTQMNDEIENDELSQVSDEIKNDQPTQMNHETKIDKFTDTKNLKPDLMLQSDVLFQNQGIKSVVDGQALFKEISADEIVPKNSQRPSMEDLKHNEFTTQCDTRIKNKHEQNIITPEECENGCINSNENTDLMADRKRDVVSHSEQEHANTTAMLIELLQSKQDYSVKHVIDIFTKNLDFMPKEKVITSEELFQDISILQSPSHEITDSEHSSTSSEEIYIQNLLAKAHQLSDNDHDISSQESSDIEMSVLSGLSDTKESSVLDNELENDDVLNNLSETNDDNVSKDINSVELNDHVWTHVDETCVSNESKQEVSDVTSVCNTSTQERLEPSDVTSVYKTSTQEKQEPSGVTTACNFSTQEKQESSDVNSVCNSSSLEKQESSVVTSVCNSSTLEKQEPSVVTSVCNSSTLEKQESSVVSSVCNSSTQEKLEPRDVASVCNSSTWEKQQPSDVTSVCNTSTQEKLEASDVASVCNSSTWEKQQPSDVTSVCNTSTQEKLEASGVTTVCNSSTLEKQEPSVVTSVCNSSTQEKLEPSDVTTVCSTSTPEKEEPGVVTSVCSSSTLEKQEPSVVTSLCNSSVLEKGEPSDVTSVCNTSTQEKLEPSDVTSVCNSSTQEKLEPNDVTSACNTSTLEKQEPSDVTSVCNTSTQEKQEPSDVTSVCNSSTQEKQEPSVVNSLCNSSVLEKGEPSDVTSVCNTSTQEKLEPSDVTSVCNSSTQEKLEPNDVTSACNTSTLEKQEPSDVTSVCNTSTQEKLEPSDVTTACNTSTQEKLEPSDVTSVCNSSTQEKLEPSDVTTVCNTSTQEKQEPSVVTSVCNSSTQEKQEPSVVTTVCSTSTQEKQEPSDVTSVCNSSTQEKQEPSVVTTVCNTSTQEKQGPSVVTSVCNSSTQEKQEPSVVTSVCNTSTQEKQGPSVVTSVCNTSTQEKLEASVVTSVCNSSTQEKQEPSVVTSVCNTLTQEKLEPSDVTSACNTSTLEKQEPNDVTSVCNSSTLEKQEPSVVTSVCNTSTQEKLEPSDVTSACNSSTLEKQEPSVVTSVCNTSTLEKQKPSDVTTVCNTSTLEKQEPSDVTSVCNTSTQEKQLISVHLPKHSFTMSNKGRQEVSKYIKEFLSKKSSGLFRQTKEPSQNSNEVVKQDVSKNAKGKKLCQNSSELSMNNKDISINNQILSIHHDASMNSSIASRKRGRPRGSTKNDMFKRRSLRKTKRMMDESDEIISLPHLCSREIPYRSKMLKTCTTTVCRSKNSVNLEKIHKPEEPLSVDEVIDILSISDDDDDFHLTLDDGSDKESPCQVMSAEQVYNQVISCSGPTNEVKSSNESAFHRLSLNGFTKPNEMIDTSIIQPDNTKNFFKGRKKSCSNREISAIPINITSSKKLLKQPSSFTTDIAFIPNYSPRRKRLRHVNVVSPTASDEVHDNIIAAKIWKLSENSLDDLIHDKDDLKCESMCGANNDSLSTVSSEYKEVNSQSSVLTNNSTDEVNKLKITLIGEKNPLTGKTNWSPISDKPKEMKKKSNVYGLRPSKTRKITSPNPAGPDAKKRRMTITDLSSKEQNPPTLLELTKRPLEEYIKGVEEEYRLSHRNPKKGLLSIAMNDHVNKHTSHEKEGDFLKLGDADVMYDTVRKAYDESKLKRCRPSPRSLYFAAKHGNALQVLVLSSGCNVNATIPQEKHKTAMHAAAGAGHVEVLRLLSILGGNLSSLDTNLQTPLFDAVENQQSEVVKFLISKNVNLNLKDSQGMTVLHVAAQKSNFEIINLLMNTHKLDVNEQDNGGWTALMWTAEGMRMDVAKCLLKWGADVNILDSEQNTCLHWAALAGDTQIMDLLLKSNVHIDAKNIFGATALHISARERKLGNIEILGEYRPNLKLTNAEGKTPIELVPVNSKCYRQLKNMEYVMNLARCTLKERLISRDISRGQEKRPIPCINEVDDEDLPHDFVYVSNNLESESQGFDRSMTGCNCTDGCVNDKLCECAQLSARKRFWYDETGRINSEIFEEDRPLVYECNMKCKCWSNCHQRVVQHGITAGLQLYKTVDKGWAVRTQSLITKGTFVCEYVGEILTDSEGNKREDDCYLFDLDVKGQPTLFCLDAKFYGNITRFINHSCDPNILPVRIFTDHQDKRSPRIAFFAARDIKPYEEVCSNYGEKFWTVKKSEFHCVCNTRKCRYGANTT